MGDKPEAKCCFCDGIMGALVKLYQGWCCVKCFKMHILQIEPSGDGTGGDTANPGKSTASGPSACGGDRAVIASPEAPEGMTPESIEEIKRYAEKSPAGAREGGVARQSGRAQDGLPQPICHEAPAIPAGDKYTSQLPDGPLMSAKAWREHVLSHPASDPVKDVYEKFKHLDKLLSDPEWVEDGTPMRNILYEVWLAVREYARKVQP